MFTDIKSTVNYKLYESGVITATLAGAGNRQAKGGREIGNKQKYFSIDKKIVRSTIIRQFNLRQNSIKFVTLTFPNDVSNKFANECLSKFVENLKENYQLKSYVAIKEFTKIGRPHFHVFADMPYINYSRLDRAWCFTFFPTCNYSPNALTTRKGKSIIRNIKRCTHYASKYVTKISDIVEINHNHKTVIHKNQEYSKVTYDQLNDYMQNRMFFCDRDILSKGYLLISGLMDYLKHIRQAILLIDSDYFQVYGMFKFTPNLLNMQRFVKNYCLFMPYIKIKRSFYLLFCCLYINICCKLLFISIKKDNFVCN